MVSCLGDSNKNSSQNNRMTLLSASDKNEITLRPPFYNRYEIWNSQHFYLKKANWGGCPWHALQQFSEYGPTQSRCMWWGLLINQRSNQGVFQQPKWAPFLLRLLHMDAQTILTLIAPEGRRVGVVTAGSCLPTLIPVDSPSAPCNKSLSILLSRMVRHHNWGG